MNIDIKLKTYEQLQFEITKLNTDIFLKDKEIERLNNVINELEKYLEENKYFYGGYQGEDREDNLFIIHALNKLKELKESGNDE